MNSVQNFGCEKLWQCGADGDVGLERQADARNRYPERSCNILQVVLIPGEGETQTYPPCPEPLHPWRILPTSHIISAPPDAHYRIRRVARGPGLRGRAWTSRVWREHGPGRRVEALALNRIGLPRYVRTHRGKSPGLLTKEWGRNFPASFVGPPTAAKIRPVSCGRAALPHVRSRGSEAVTPPCAWK